MALVCKWGNPCCLLAFPTAEELFNHLCDVHVGRKRHGNLSLSCSWEACDHKAAKRDHMTSHMMVHCPLQTNVCGICSKTFKRSYDLRKHEITHTAAHHQAHGRSRAMIYNEVEISFTSPINKSSSSVVGSVHHSRVYSCPRDQSVDSLMLSAQSTPIRRGSSVPGSRNKPYLRPKSCTPTPSTRPHSDSNGHHPPIARTLSNSFINPSYISGSDYSENHFIHATSFPAFKNPYQPHPADRERLAKREWSADDLPQKPGYPHGGSLPASADYSSVSGGKVEQGGMTASLDYVGRAGSSFNPYASYDSANPVSYPLVDEPSTRGDDLQLLSYSAQDEAHLHFTHTPSTGHLQYTELDGYGQPAWQQPLPLAVSEPPILFPSAPPSFDWSSSSSSSTTLDTRSDPLGLDDILSQFHSLVNHDHAPFNDYFSTENPLAFSTHNLSASSELFYPL